jgi:putative colanic acid biosynthesis UDP-glucose lipid carrier transferase
MAGPAYIAGAVMPELKPNGIFHQYQWLLTGIQRVLDGLVVAVLLLFLAHLQGVPLSNRHIALAGVTFLLVLLVFNVTHLYRPWRGVNPIRLMRRVFLSWALVAMMLLMLGFATQTSALYSRKMLFLWACLAPMALVALRVMLYLILRRARARGRNSRTVVIAGAGDLGRQLAGNVVDTPWLGMDLKGFFDDQKVGEKVVIRRDWPGYPVLGDLDDMVAFVQQHKIDMVYLALPMRAEERLRQVVDALQDTTASVYLAPDVFTFSLLQASITDLRGMPLISLWESPFYGLYGWLKRAEDILVASLVLLLTAPLMLLIAFGVKLSSPGPVLFKQRRYGLAGEEIRVYKFRTMTVCEDGSDFQQVTRNDCRVTPFGAFLRRTSLDEIPQFWNVLTGIMSVVGPRPHPVAMDDSFRRQIPGYVLRQKVRPGITGWAQVNGWRGETDTLEKMEKRLEYDLDYLRNWSLWLDVKIIFLTVLRGFTDKHAY